MSENPVEERYSLLKSYEDDLVELESSIDSILESKITNSKQNDFEYAVDSLFRLFSSRMGDVEEEIAWKFLDLIYQVNGGNIGDLSEFGFSQEFVQMVAILSSKYESDMLEVKLRGDQGENFWKTVETEYVVREERGVYGLNHSIVRSDDKVEITTDLSSNFHLAEYLIDQQVVAMNRFDVEQLGEVNLERIEDLESRLKELKEQLSENE